MKVPNYIKKGRTIQIVKKLIQILKWKGEKWMFQIVKREKGENNSNGKKIKKMIEIIKTKSWKWMSSNCKKKKCEQFKLWKKIKIIIQTIKNKRWKMNVSNCKKEKKGERTIQIVKKKQLKL